MLRKINILTIFFGLFLANISFAGVMPEAEKALISSDTVKVLNKRKFYGFEPAVLTHTKGVIIYPGGFVDPKGYAPIARELAENGYYAAIAKMPLNFPLLDICRASKIIKHYDYIDGWVMAGHSVGGTAMATYANHHDKPHHKIDGIIFLASYPTPFIENISNDPYKVVSIYATEDGLTSLSDIENSKKLLPEDTKFVKIEGGNHAQFGYYGDQDGDNPAKISREEQQNIIMSEFFELLEELEE